MSRSQAFPIQRTGTTNRGRSNQHDQPAVQLLLRRSRGVPHPRRVSREAFLTLPLPVSIALVGDVLTLEFPDGHQLKLSDDPRGWKQLRDICVARQLATYNPTIGQAAKPVQHMADIGVISRVISSDRDEKIMAARAKLKELGLR